MLPVSRYVARRVLQRGSSGSKALASITSRSAISSGAASSPNVAPCSRALTSLASLRFSTSANSDRRGDLPDSHDDFKPQYKSADEAIPVHEMIAKDIKMNPVMVYMKGVPDAPQCGFSAMVCRILEEHAVVFKTRNVLEDSELRDGVKAFSKWPTIPQIYVNGEFVGGCDILLGMHRNGELEDLLRSVRKKQLKAEAK